MFYEDLFMFCFLYYKGFLIIYLLLSGIPVCSDSLGLKVIDEKVGYYWTYQRSHGFSFYFFIIRINVFSCKIPGETLYVLLSFLFYLDIMSLILNIL